jgi:hypothetical protein
VTGFLEGGEELLGLPAGILPYEGCRVEDKIVGAVSQMHPDIVDATFAIATEQRRRGTVDVHDVAGIAIEEAAHQADRIHHLLRHAEHLSAAIQLDETWRKHRSETEALKNSLRTLNDKIEEAKRKKNLLLARQRRAEAQKRIAQTMGSKVEVPL